MKFLLDAHVSPGVAAAFRKLGGKSEVIHMRDWRGGLYIHQHGGGDKPWLKVAGEEGWIVVHNDTSTLIEDYCSLAKDGGKMPGLVMTGPRVFDVGWLARRLLEVESKLGDEEPGSVQIWL